MSDPSQPWYRRSISKSGSIAIIAAVVVLVLGVVVGLTLVNTNSTQNVAAPVAPESCAAFLAMPPAEQASIAATSVGGPDSMVVYDDAGAAVLTKSERLALACSGSSAPASFSAATAAAAIDTSPLCTEFEAAERSIAESWADAFWMALALAQPSGAVDSVDQLSLACLSVPDAKESTSLTDVAAFSTALAGKDESVFLNWLQTGQLPAGPALLSFTAESSDGYTIDLTATVAPVRYTASVENALPGFLDLTTDLNISTSATNTTSGREAPSVVTFTVLAVYSRDSAVCSIGPDLDASVAGFTGERAWISDSACFVRIGVFALASPLPSGASVAVPSSVEAVQNPSYTATSSVVSGVPDAAADALLGALNSPIGYAAVQSRTNGSDEVFWPLTSQCLVTASTIYGNLRLNVASTSAQNVCG